MPEYLIQEQTLKSTADKLREYIHPIGDNTHVINSDFVEVFATDTVRGLLVQGSAEVFYYENIDDESGFILSEYVSEDPYHGGIAYYAYLPNQNGDVVPVVYLLENNDLFTEPCFYVGTEEIDGTSYDKWRRIETTDREGGTAGPDNYTWEADREAYFYTNRIVQIADGADVLISPLKFPEKISEVYDRGVADGGFGKVNTSDATAIASHILDGDTAYVDGVKIVGTMTDHGSVTMSLAAGASYTIPEGYHDGGGQVTTKTLANQTPGTATANTILAGESAWVDGVKITGNIPSKTDSDITVGGREMSGPSGYYPDGVYGSVDFATRAPVTITTTNNNTTGQLVVTAVNDQPEGYINYEEDGYQSARTVVTLTQNAPFIDLISNRITASSTMTDSSSAKTVTKSNEISLTTQAAKTVRPTEEVQTAVAAGVYTTGNVEVEAISPDHVGSNAQTKVDSQAIKIQELRDLVASKSSGGGGSGGGNTPAEIDIFPLQTVEGFVEDTETLIGTYYAYVPTFEIKDGETYYVEWDDYEEPFTCKGMAVSFNGINAVYLGNGSMLGYPSNDEPFAVVYLTDLSLTEFVANDTKTSHDIRVYQKAGSVIMTSLTITENGTYQAPKGKAYSSVTVEVESGGGGGDDDDKSLYWRVEPKIPAKLSANPRNAVTINNKIYVELTDANTSVVQLWEFDGTSWRFFSNAVNSSQIDWYHYIEYNGEIHAIKKYSINPTPHYKYDTESGTWVQVSSIPVNTNANGHLPFVYNNELYVLLNGSGERDIYKFNGTSWDVYLTVSVDYITSSYGYCVIGNKIYVITSSKLASVNLITGEYTVEVENFTYYSEKTITGRLHVINNTIYLVNSANGPNVRFKNGQREEISQSILRNDYHTQCTLNNRVYCIGNGTNWVSYNAMASWQPE